MYLFNDKLIVYTDLSYQIILRCCNENSEYNITIHICVYLERISKEFVLFMQIAKCARIGGVNSKDMIRNVMKRYLFIFVELAIPTEVISTQKNPLDKDSYL